jgi:hypothetical protein
MVEGYAFSTFIAWTFGVSVFSIIVGAFVKMILEQPKSILFATFIAAIGVGVIYYLGFVVFPFPMDVFELI